MKHVEYQVRLLDKFGDSIDPEFFNRLTDANKRFLTAELDGEAVAIVLEKSASWWTEDGNKEDEEYQLLQTRGDMKALQEGGWLSRE